MATSSSTAHLQFQSGGILMWRTLRLRFGRSGCEGWGDGEVGEVMILLFNLVQNWTNERLFEQAEWLTKPTVYHKDPALKNWFRSRWPHLCEQDIQAIRILQFWSWPNDPLRWTSHYWVEIILIFFFQFLFHLTTLFECGDCELTFLT